MICAGLHCVCFKHTPWTAYPTSDGDLFNIVVSGLCDDSALYNSTLYCNIILQCLDCATNTVRNTESEECTSSVIFNDLPSGKYQLRRNIATICGQHITPDPEYFNIGG